MSKNLELYIDNLDSHRTKGSPIKQIIALFPQKIHSPV